MQTQLIQSSTYFEVSLKSLTDSYHFMFIIHGYFEHGKFEVPPIQSKFNCYLIQSASNSK